MQELCVGDAKRYNEIIQHETLRVAVIGMVLNETSLSIPACFIKVMEKSFLQFYDHYVETAKNNLNLDGQKMMVSISSVIFYVILTLIVKFNVTF